MSVRLSIRPAVMEDIGTLARLRRQCLADAPQGAASVSTHLEANRPESVDRVRTWITDGCVLLGRAGNNAVASAALDLDEAEIAATWVAPRWQGRGIGRRMIEAVERLAVQYGLMRLGVRAPESAAGFFAQCRYRPVQGSRVRPDPDTGVGVLSLERRFPRRQTRFGARVRRVHRDLGIPEDYGRRHRLALQPECRELATIGPDIFDREQWLAPPAARAWLAMRAAARDDDIDLQAASAFRSVDYQASMVKRKQRRGQNLEEILSVSAAPGFSEHHTGRAIDVASSDVKPLETCFENTPAFEWLMESAPRFGFHLSYPRNNRHGIAYEPWHWLWEEIQ